MTNGRDKMMPINLLPATPVRSFLTSCICLLAALFGSGSALAQAPGLAQQGVDINVPTQGLAPAAKPPLSSRQVEGSVASGRLQLDSVQARPEIHPVLRLSPEILTATDDDPKRRADAAALWRTLSVSPDEAIREGRRLPIVQAESGAVTTQGSEARLADLQRQLDLARQGRWTDPLFWLVMLATFATATFLGRRIQRGVEARGRDVAETLQPSVFRPTVIRPDPAQPITSDQQALLRTKPKQPVSAKETNDLRRQADFLCARGQFQKAEKILRNHIEEHSNARAQVFLDLLRIYHWQQRPDDYEAVRQMFCQAFRVQAPGFDQHGQEGRLLEDYPSALSRIQELWPSAQALAFIDELIFRQDSQTDAESFDLAALQELLLLRSVCKVVLAIRAGASLAPSTKPVASNKRRSSLRNIFGSTGPQPLFDSEAGVSSMTPDTALGRLNLDIDLDAFGLETKAGSETAADGLVAEGLAPSRDNLLEFQLSVSDAATPKTPGSSGA